MRIHPDYHGMLTHQIETCRKSLFIKKIVVFKNKGERVISILQRDVYLCLKRRAIAMPLRLNDIEINAGGIGRIAILPHPGIGKAVCHKGNANRRLSIVFHKPRCGGEQGAAPHSYYIASSLYANILKLPRRIKVHHKISCS